MGGGLRTRGANAGRRRAPYLKITVMPPYLITARSVTVPSAFARSSTPGFSACQFLIGSASYWNVGNGRQMTDYSRKTNGYT